jgi:hypothetical protein
LWLQLDQNIFEQKSDANLTRTAPELERVPFTTLDSMLAAATFEGGQKITSVRDARNNPLKYTIVKTMLRIDLPTPLAPGQNVQFAVDWNYNINDARVRRARRAA